MYKRQVQGQVLENSEPPYPMAGVNISIKGTKLGTISDQNGYFSIKAKMCIRDRTEASFPHFFPYKVLYGDLNEVLTQPNKIALSEKCAQKYFGKENPIGQTIITGENNVTTRVREDGTIEEGKNETTYQIAAVLKSRKQSYICLLYTSEYR